MLNLLATLNENPHIRYYQPTHHSPLGPLAPQAGSSSLTAPSPQQQTQSLRWRSAVGEGAQSRAPNPAGSPGAQGPEYISGKIAKRVQADLDEYMTNNPEFPVS